MSKITRENIVDSIDFKESVWGDGTSATWTSEEITNAMVAAYNQGVSDAVKELSEPEHQIELGIVNKVLKLKI